MRKGIDITNQKFGKLTAIEVCGKRKGIGFLWKCVCDCGKETSVFCNYLRAGKIKSCGCNIIESNLKRFTKHGYSSTNKKRSPEYIAWSGMKSRCLNPNSKAYKNYGARGIKICDEWIISFSQFLKDMGEKPSSKLSLERRENDKDYCPSNCYWANKKTQNCNTRRNNYLEYKGMKLTVTNWALILKVKYPSITRRLKKQPFNEIVEYFMKKNSIKEIRLCL